MKDLSRRTFLVSGLTTLVVGGALRSSLREALAEARVTGKPLLTIGNLNKLFADGANNKALAAEVVQSGKGFITSRFTLTAIQARSIKGVPDLKVKEIQEAMKKIAKEGGSVQVTEQRAGDQGKTVSVSTQRAPSIDVALSLK